MLPAQVGCVCLGFILYFSGVQAEQEMVCALKGSTVELPCSAERSTANMRWFIINQNGAGDELKLNAEGNNTYVMSDSNFTLTIHKLTESDSKIYCCRGNTDTLQKCKQRAIKLQVTDVQVKVIPAAQGHTVNLVCGSSCPLTDYSWYRNGRSLYVDPSPWYQELVSSEEAATYSCGLKGHRDLRAPKVSVDSVTSACFTVTYAKGRMCSYQQKSENESCSITFPREVHVEKTPGTSNNVKLSCNTSCPLTDPQTFTWYKNHQRHVDRPSLSLISSADSFSCAVKGHEDLTSADVCVVDGNCWTVNYVSRRICALLGSTVNILSKYSHPSLYNNHTEKYWYKLNGRSKKGAEKVRADTGRVEYSENVTQHILTIKKLKKNDSAEYMFRLQEKKSDDPGVTLVVTSLTVKFIPSPVVTEGDRVTLTCSTSCPLTDTNYVWYFNGRPLTPSQTRNKHLVLEPVSRQHAGIYSCRVTTNMSKSSNEKTLAVKSVSTITAAAAAGVTAVLLVTVTPTVFCWIRRKRTSGQSPRAETSVTMDQLHSEHVYEAPYDDEPQYSSNPLYSTIQHEQLQELDHTPYAVVHLRSHVPCE